MTKRLQGLACAVIGAALLALLIAAPTGLAQAAGVPLAEASDAQKKEAQEAYLEAKKHFDAGRYDEALAGFRASYDVVASPNSHHMLVRTLDALGRTVEAYHEAVRTVTEAEAAAAQDEKYDQTAAAARAKRDALRAKVALLTVVVEGADDDATVTIDGRRLGRAAWGVPQPVLPGARTVRLEAAAGTAEEQVELASGGEKTVHLRASAGDAGGGPSVGSRGSPDAGSSGLRIASYVFGGLGIAGFGMFAVGGALHLSEYGDLRDRCEAGLCPAGSGTSIDSGRTYQAIANAGVVVGALGLTTGLLMFIGSQPDVHFEARRSASSPAVAIGPGSITVRGQF